jgi:hypothetical protein
MAGAKEAPRDRVILERSGKLAKAESKLRKRIASANRTTFILYGYCVTVKSIPIFVFQE